MSFMTKLFDYWSEIVLLIKNNWIVLLSFLLVTAVLDFTAVSFISIFLMILLIALLSKTEEYKRGTFKVLNFFLYFLFISFFIMLFSVPATVFLIGFNVTEVEQIASSHLVKTSVNVGAWVSLVFVFAPYRIFDANYSLYKALKYSNSVIIEYPLIFTIILLFSFVLVFVTEDMPHTDFIIYLLILVATVSLYKLNVKNIIKKETAL